LRAGRPAIDTNLPDAVFDLLQQSGDANHKKFVQIGADDRQKLDALEQRIARIASLFEDPALKLEEAQFWIQVERKLSRSHARLSLKAPLQY